MFRRAISRGIGNKGISEATGRAYPPDHVLLATTRGSQLRTLVGPQHQTSYTGNFTMPDGTVKSVPVDANGLYCGPGITNLFTNVTPTVETKTLTAQKYCLQVFGAGASCIAGINGSASVDTPLVFTPLAGACIFTPTNCTSWILTASGGYVFPYLPPGTTNPSAAGSTGGNGCGWPLTGSAKADKVIESFRGVTDGVELVTNGTFTGIANGTDIITRPGWYVYGSPTTRSIQNETLRIETNATNQGADLSLSCNIGDRFRFRCTATGNLGYGGIFINSSVSTLSGVIDVEFTATTTYFDIRFRAGDNQANKITYYDNISIQKLLPSVFTLAATVRMGVGSGEVPANVYGVVSTSNSNYLGALYWEYTGSSGVSAEASDGASYPFKLQEWLRSEIHRKIVQTNTAGTQFRVGNQRLTATGTLIGANPVYSAWSAYDGSMNPLTMLRLALSGTVPMHLIGLGLSNKSLDAANMMRMIGRYERGCF